MLSAVRYVRRSLSTIREVAVYLVILDIKCNLQTRSDDSTV
jgi:hypothetical protein